MICADCLHNDHRRLFRPDPLDLLGLGLAFWTGWAAIVALLQIWHLAFPVSRAALALVLLLGATGLLLEARSLAGLARTGAHRAPALVVLLIPALLWMANRSAGPAQFFDLGLSYLQAVQWNSSYPIVPGLGNLHGRLAFNSAYLLYGAPWLIRCRLPAGRRTLPAARCSSRCWPRAWQGSPHWSRARDCPAWPSGTASS